MRMQAIVNCRAGSIIDRAPEEITAIVSALLASGGAEVEVECIRPERLGDALDRALAAPPDVLVIGGGDGTIRTAARRLLDGDVALGILPLGTTNRTARDLGIPLALEEAAAALATADIAKIDVGEVNGSIFLCNSLLGLPIVVARARKIVRGAPLLARVRSYGALLVTLFKTTRKISIELEDGVQRRRVRALSIAIANNAYDEAPTLILARGRLDGGELAIYLVRHPNGRAMAFAMLRAMLGRWRDDPDVEEIKVQRATLHPKARRILVCNDGEVEDLTGPLRYRIRPQALRVLKPRAARQEAGAAA